MDMIDLLVSYAPSYLPWLAVLFLILFTRDHLYKGMISAEAHKEQLAREREFIAAQRDYVASLQEIARQLESLTMKVSEEIGQTTARLASLERFMSDFIGEFNTLNHSFELHRKGVPPTEVFRQPRQEG
jgi:hypothetical protein